MTLPYVKSGSSIRRLHPLSCSITLNVKPLSTVRMTLPQTDEISIWEWVTVPVPDGSTIWCQVVTIETDAETGRKDVYLEHGARTLDAATIRRDDGLTKTPYAFKTGNPPVVMTVSQIMTKILSYQSPARWTVGTIAQAIAGQAVYMEPEGMSLTTAILTMMESIPAYQANFVQASDSDWHIDIVARPTTVQAEVRLNRNLRSCEISCNASAICTRVWCEGITGGKMDSANTSLYGVREETMSLNDSLTTAQKEAIVTAYLAAHDHPIISLSISGYELSQITGLDIDSLLLGQLCRVAVPWLGVTESEVIVTKTYGDAYNAPDEVTVSLADQTPDLSIVVASITGGGGGGGGGQPKESPLKRFQTKFEQTDELFRLLATDTQWDDLGHGTLTAYGQLVITSSSIQQVISSVGQNGQVTAASITLAINESGSNAYINADHIILSGNTTVAGMLSVDGGALVVNGTVQARDNVECDAVEFELSCSGPRADFNQLVVMDSIQYGSNLVKWASQSVVTGVTITLPSIERSDNERFVYARNGDMNDLQLKSGRLVTAYTVGSVNVSSTTLYYLAKDDD